MKLFTCKQKCLVTKIDCKWHLFFLLIVNHHCYGQVHAQEVFCHFHIVYGRQFQTSS
jgi:hypothetical protein